MRGSTRCRGVVAPLVAVVFVVLMGFAALAIDIGFVFNSRGEMQNAVDAGALAGAGALEIGNAEAEARARDATHRNGVAGAVVADEEIVATVGNWNGVDLTFSPAVGDETVVPNAVQVVANRLGQGLFFAHMLGVSTTDIGREAVGALGGGVCAGVWGLNGITGNGNIYTDSYNSDEGPYGLNDVYPNGDLCSNGDISLAGSVEIHGDVMYGEGYDMDIAGGANEIWGVVDEQSIDMIPPTFDMEAAMANNDNATIGLTDGGGIAAAEHDRDLHLVTVAEKSASVIQLGLQVVDVDVRAELDLLDRDAGLFLASFLGLLVGLESMFAPVHDAHDDGTRVGRYLDKIQTGFFGCPTSFVERDDADLLAVGADEPYWTQSDLIVNTHVVVD